MIDFELALAHENQFKEFSKETDQFIKWVGNAFCTTSITLRLDRLKGLGGGERKAGKTGETNQVWRDTSIRAPELIRQA